LDRSLAGPKRKAGAKLTCNIIAPQRVEWYNKLFLVKITYGCRTISIPETSKNDDKPGIGKSYVTPF
jgi:hypothetical protein